MTEFSQVLPLVAVAVLAALFVIGLGKLLNKEKAALPQQEETVALAAYHALLAAQAKAEQAVVDATAARDAVKAKVAQYKAAVASATA